MKVIAMLLLVLLIATGFFLRSGQPEYHISRGEELVNVILGRTAKIIRDKYGVRPCGAGISMPGGPIQKMTLCFTTNYPYSKKQLRESVILFAYELLNQVQENEEIQQFIKDPPFTIKNIQIIIYNHDKDGCSVLDPGIANVDITKGILEYCTIDPEDTFKYKNKFMESYEEALSKCPSFREKYEFK